ncbi:MAG: hypothetical protein IPO37_03980 [Saprospiraceae bacterium]|nr:hypothetical protein [Saprospiraceae bacterium]
MKAVIIEYGMGNVASVQKALSYLNINNIISNNYNDIANADVIILPGVGAFKQGMENLKLFNLIDVLNNEVLVKKTIFRYLFRYATYCNFRYRGRRMQWNGLDKRGG